MATTIPTAPAAPQAPGGGNKPGYKTTEFWMSVAAVIASALAQISGILPEPWGPVLATASAVAYTLSRGMAKSGTIAGP